MAARKAGGEKDGGPDLLRTVFEVIAEIGPRDGVARRAAERAGVTLAELYRQFPTEAALIRALGRRVDEQMLESDQTELDALPARDRVFELMMCRFEALQPFRAGLRRLARARPRDPLLLLDTACRLDRSLSWLQTAADLPTRGLRARWSRRMLGLVYLRTMQVWFDDEGLDMAKTMAQLDRNLRRAESLTGLGERRGQAEPAEPAGQPA